MFLAKAKQLLEEQLRATDWNLLSYWLILKMSQLFWQSIESLTPLVAAEKEGMTASADTKHH
jgi:hypothetical protein